VALAAHLLKHALRDIVVTPPVGGPLGIGELVHVVAVERAGEGAVFESQLREALKALRTA
jgi:hypothetical protein